MEVTREVNKRDLNYILHSIAQKKISYITKSQVIDDYQNRRLFILKNGSSIPVAMCAITWNEKHKYYSVRRLLVFKNANRGKGYADAILKAIFSLEFSPMGGTPWIDNYKTRHLLEKNGFTLRYIFSEHWCYYERSF